MELRSLCVLVLASSRAATRRHAPLPIELLHCTADAGLPANPEVLHRECDRPRAHRRDRRHPAKLQPLAPPGETALTGPGTVSVTLPLFHELPYRNLRLTPAFDILDASAGRVSQLIEAPYYAADRWHTRSFSGRRCRLPGTMFQEEH